MRALILIVAISCSLTVASQELFSPSHSLKVDMGLPVSQANKPYKSIMQGLFNMSTYYQYTLPFGLNFGGGGNVNYFTVNEFRLPGQVNGGITTVGGFGKIGFEKFFTPKIVADFGVKAGYSYSFSKTSATLAKIGKAHEYDAPYIEPMINLYLMADEQSGFSLSIGYVFRGVKFNASHIMVDEITGYEPEEFGAITQFFVFGFGYTYYFGNKKQ